MYAPTQAELDEQFKKRQVTNAQKSTAKRGPKPVFGPLVPQERPLVLPGGRKWKTPKDAFNEEFIAEVISSQAELITGTTLG